MRLDVLAHTPRPAPGGRADAHKTRRVFPSSGADSVTNQPGPLPRQVGTERLKRPCSLGSPLYGRKFAALRSAIHRQPPSPYSHHPKTQVPAVPGLPDARHRSAWRTVGTILATGGWAWPPAAWSSGCRPRLRSAWLKLGLPSPQTPPLGGASPPRPPISQCGRLRRPHWLS
jgi:hypothetical protein